jgi:hypothetical protein
MSQITVLMPTSPIPAHPSTDVIESTINSVRENLPEAPIIIMIDGVRSEQEHRRKDYYEYVERLKILCQTWKNVSYLVFNEYSHQAEMTRCALELVKTPLILFMEHDTFFTGPIDWEGIERVVIAGDANMVGFYCMLQSWIHPEHVYLTLENERRYYQGVPMVRTWQWSQRPHVSPTDFYCKIIQKYFTPSSRTMIEDRMYGVVMGTRADRGAAGWDMWKIMYYAPEGGINRSHTVNGRQSDPKYPMTL